MDREKEAIKVKSRILLLSLSTMLAITFLGRGAHAQGMFWKPCNGPFGGRVNSLVLNTQGTIFAGGAFQYNSAGKRTAGLYSAASQRPSFGWKLIPLDSSLSIGTSDFYVFLTPSSTLLAVAKMSSVYIIYRSIDQGVTWAKSSASGILPPTTMESVQVGGLTAKTLSASDYNPNSGKVAFAHDSSGRLYLSFAGVIMSSADDGMTWLRSKNGLPTTPFPFSPFTIATSGDTLYTSGGQGIFYSGDHGQNWNLLNGNIAGAWELQCISKSELLISAWGNGVMRSIDGGRNFVASNTGLESYSYVYALTKAPDGTYYASALSSVLNKRGLFASVDSGRTWIQKGEPYGTILSLAFDSTGGIYGGGWGFGVQKSTDGGTTWAQMAIGMDYPGMSNQSFYANDLGYIVAAGDGLLFTSTDEGGNWTSVKTLPSLNAYRTVKGYDGKVFVISFANDATGEIYMSTDNGGSWMRQSNGASFGGFNGNLLDLRTNTLLAATANGGVVRSTDNGKTWAANIAPTTSGYFLSGSNAKTGSAFCLDYSTSTTSRSTDDGLTWQQLTTPLGYVVSNSRGDLFSYWVPVVGLIQSMDDGTTWSSILAQNPFRLVVNATDQIYLLVAYDSKLQVSNDNGKSWSRVSNSGIGIDSTKLGSTLFSLLSNGKLVAAAGMKVHLYVSNTTTNVPPVAYGSTTTTFDTVSVGKRKDTVLSLTNNWVDTLHLTIASSNAMFSVLTPTVVVPRGTTVVDTIRFAPSKGGAATGSLVVRSGDTFLVNDTLSVAGVGVTTSGVHTPADIPKVYALDQNYPNPFNPSTTIRFAVPVRSRVEVTVFNILGQQVAKLVDKEMNAGYGEEVWNANVTSGLYFYQIRAVAVDDANKRFVETRKMTLLK